MKMRHGKNDILQRLFFIRSALYLRSGALISGHGFLEVSWAHELKLNGHVCFPMCCKMMKIGT